MGYLVGQRTTILIDIEQKRDEGPPGEGPGNDSLALLEELKGITKRMRENDTEAEWLECQIAGKKFRLGAAQTQHVVVSV